MNQTMHTKWIALSERVYCALLILYPADYRREYSSLMVQLFRDVSRDTYHRQGLTGITLWWCRTLLDLTLTVIEHRRKVKFAMSKSAFVQITGMLLILGGVCIALATFSQLQPGDRYSYYGVYEVLRLLFAPGFLLVGLGCIGLGLRYDQTLGTPGQWALYLSGIGAFVIAAGMVATLIDDSLFMIWFGAGILHSLALTVFGILHVRKPTLPIFRALPLQMGAGWLILMLGIVQTNSETLNNALVFLVWLGTGLAWLGIGLAVNRQQREALLVAT